MSVVFQAIANMPGLKEYFLGNIHIKEMVAEGGLGVEDNLIYRLGELVQLYHSYNDHVFEPTRLFEIISEHSKFNPRQSQEDAHEFLMYMLERISGITNRYALASKE